MSRLSLALVWLRRDLRLHDHRAFFEATRAAEQVLPIYVIDDGIIQALEPDNRRVTFIQACLDELDAGLRAKGGRLLVQRGDPVVLLPKLAREYGAQAVYAARDYEPRAKQRDRQVAESLAAIGVELRLFKDQVIFEGREVVSQSGKPYQVFTPYSRAWLKHLHSAPAAITEYRPQWKRLLPAIRVSHSNTSFFDLGFEPQELSIAPGEKAARRALRDFQGAISQYHRQRDLPAVDGTSRLSPHFRFGTLSIRDAVRFCDDHLSAGAKVWLNELIWRDFFQMILDQYPHVADHAFRPEYDRLEWPGTQAHFLAWCEGRTGYPIVDAAMRQLNETGWMHNRLRMITAMFLTKDLLVHWKWGEAYFARQLLDHELASNNGGWQWSASTGCDAQPYFRIFNPVTQSKKFDPEGVFIRRFVPELREVRGRAVHWPYDRKGNPLTPGYPAPIVDHAVQRDRAIRMFRLMR